MLSMPEYLEQIAATRDERMQWWREARFGVFVHYGLYAQIGRNEWVQACENIPADEYEKLAETFAPKEGCCREWAAMAKKAGAKYMVLTTRHHEGFSLWDSKVNPFNSVNYGPHRDIVREFVDSSLMDWHHPDGSRCAYDNAARERFTKYIRDLNEELLTRYGKIDVLWYDVACPMQHWEGWDSLARNQYLRTLQPHILINDRSRIPEDFGTPEEHITPADRDWEACMTFNGISWGYVDSAQAAPYSYSPQRILGMLQTCCERGGNLLLNFGPTPDGSVPQEAVEPLTQVGRWLAVNGEAVYGKLEKTYGNQNQANGVSRSSTKGNTVYMWNKIWAPYRGQMILGGFENAPRAVSLMDGTPIEFEHKGARILLKNVPQENPDPILHVPIIKIEFDEPPKYRFASYLPQLHEGRPADTEIL